MDGERENCASRRALLKGAPALAVIAAVAAETGIALANASDPYVGLCAEWHRRRAAVNATPGEAGDSPTFRGWIDTEDKLTATGATTMAGALAGLRIARIEFAAHYEGGHEGEFVAALIESAITVLDRETARV